MYSFARTAVTACHKLGDFSNKTCAGGQKSETKACVWWVASRALREGGAPGLSPWLVDGCLSPGLFTSSSLCVYLYVYILLLFCLFLRPPVMLIGAHL